MRTGETRRRGSRVICRRRPPLIPLASIAGMVLAMLTVPMPASARPDFAGPSWQRFVVAPTSRDVRPVRVLPSSGGVTNPNGLLGGGVTPLNRPAPAPKRAWPGGTAASASSFHGPNNGSDGRPRSYEPANAVDGNTDTFWNDDTFGGYPDVLTITPPGPVGLPGITVPSNADGVPQDFTAAASDGAAWRAGPTGTRNTQAPATATVAAPGTT